jgi:hypothetical protein
LGARFEKVGVAQTHIMAINLSQPRLKLMQKDWKVNLENLDANELQGRLDMLRKELDLCKSKCQK